MHTAMSELKEQKRKEMVWMKMTSARDFHFCRFLIFVEGNICFSPKVQCQRVDFNLNCVFSCHFCTPLALQLSHTAQRFDCAQKGAREFSEQSVRGLHGAIWIFLWSSKKRQKKSHFCPRFPGMISLSRVAGDFKRLQTMNIFLFKVVLGNCAEKCCVRSRSNPEKTVKKLQNYWWPLIWCIYAESLVIWIIAIR